MAITVAAWNDLDADARRQLLQRPAMADATEVRASVNDILGAVRASGDAKIRELTLSLDQADVDDLRVRPAEVEAATQILDPEAIDAIDQAITNVRRFHEQQLPQDISIETLPGVLCERVSCSRYRPQLRVVP
jgi:histidinol dehydrogenase